MTILLLIITGLMVGIISSFFGVGGGIVAVPVLYALFPNLPPQTIIGTSLGMIFLNSILNTFNFYNRGKRAETKIIFPMAIAIAIGVISGGKLTSVLNPKSIKIIFASVVFLVALKTLFTKIKATQDKDWTNNLKSTSSLIKSFFATFLGGIISGLTGLGGGAIIVPLFITILHMPFTEVPFYSNIIMGVGTLIGVSTYMLMTPTTPIQIGPFFEIFQIGYVNWGLTFFLFFGAYFTSPIGVKWSQNISPVITKRLFGTLLIIVAIRMILKA